MDPDHPALPGLEPSETVHAIIPALSGDVVVTDRRIAVVIANRVALNIPHERLRRVEFDIERGRPATLVLVPEGAADEPQVLAIPVDANREVAQALIILGQKLHEFGPRSPAHPLDGRSR